MTVSPWAGQTVEADAGHVGAKALGRLHRQDEKVDPRLGVGGGGELHQLGLARARVEGARQRHGRVLVRLEAPARVVRL